MYRMYALKAFCSLSSVTKTKLIQREFRFMHKNKVIGFLLLEVKGRCVEHIEITHERMSDSVYHTNRGSELKL